jgi:tellurite resistance protein TerC
MEEGNESLHVGRGFGYIAGLVMFVGRSGLLDLSHMAAWGGFLALVLTLLGVDLFLLHRKPHEIRLREALIGAMIPVVCALAFAGAIYVVYEYHLLEMGTIPDSVKGRAREMWPDSGNEAVLMYLTGYLIEISLSADNVFLFVLLLNFFVVPKIYQHRVLFWGVLGALVMRAVMIIAGTALIQRFEWIILVFGVFLVFTGLKMLFSGAGEADPGKSFAVRIARKVLRITPGFHEQNFFVRVPAGGAEGGKAGAARLWATPLFLALICVEVTDVVFAVDSIPAVFAVTYDPFIVFTSNVLAILGLRSLYFLLAGVMDKFHYLKMGLAVVLAFVGVKMLLPALGRWVGNWQGGHEYHWHIPTPISLLVILLALLVSIIASLAFPKGGGGGQGQGGS